MTLELRSYTTIDVAKRLGVSLQTVQRWVDAGHLRAWKTPGGHRRIDAASAELLFKEQASRIGGSTSPDVQAEAVAPAAALSVVVVDDDPLDRALLTMFVRDALPDALVESADNGFQGLVVIGRTSPDIVITDIHMPHMDGMEMLRHLLADQSTRPRMLLAVSALSRQELASKGTLPSGVELFTKPLEQDRFVAHLRTIR